VDHQRIPINPGVKEYPHMRIKDKVITKSELIGFYLKGCGLQKSIVIPKGTTGKITEIDEVGFKIRIDKGAYPTYLHCLGSDIRKLDE
jgi:hypothetical protein